MEAIILAGGLGTRLKSVVADIPKCMAPIKGKPFLWYLLKDLSKYPDMNKVILSVGYLREHVIEWVEQNKSEFPFPIDYVEESHPLGTGGGIRLALKKTSEEDVVVLNGDTYFSIDLQALYNAHKGNKDSAITIALKQMKDFDRYGTVEITPEGKIAKFIEKKFCNEGLINGGIYVISKESKIFDNMPEKFSFESDIMEKICGMNGKVYGSKHEGYFIDIGVPADYQRAETELPSIHTDKENNQE